jgi:hypothetical protein
MTVERPDAGYERRSLWLGIAIALVVAWRGPFAYFGDKDLQVWLYVASAVALGLSLVLCVLLIVPEFRARVLPQFRSERAMFSWAFALFVLGIVITIAAEIQGAIDSLDEDRPF